MISSDRQNVLLLIPDLGHGGAERAISRLSVELQKNYNVYLCRFTDQDSIVYPTGGKLISLNEPGKTKLWQKPKSFYARVTKLKKLKRDLSIHVSISFLEGANYVNVLSRHREKVVISLRGSIMDDRDIDGIGGTLRKRIFIPMLYKRADKIIALSEGLKEELLESFGVTPEKLEVIYNHFNSAAITNLAQKKVPVGFERLLTLPVLVMSGRLHQQKGHRQFLKVFRAVRSVIPCRLIIFGDGALRNELISYSKNLGLRTFDIWSGQDLPSNCDVYFMGYVKNPFHYISRSAAFVFPSLYEGLGNALVEALACNILVISADCHSGPREVLAPGSNYQSKIQKAEYAEYGILMPVLNNQSAENIWIKELNKILTDSELRSSYARKSSDRLRAFDPEYILPKWRAIIKD